MSARAAAVAGEGQFVRVRLDVGQQRGVVRPRHVLVRDQHHRCLADDRDRLQVLLNIDGDFWEQLLDGADRRPDGQHRIAVRRGLADLADRDRATSAGLVLHHDVLAEGLRHVIGDDARRHVHGAAGARGADHGDVALRIGRLRRRSAPARAPRAGEWMTADGTSTRLWRF